MSLARADSVVLDRHRLYMLPTRQGLIFTATLLAMLLAAVNYANSMAFAFTFLLGAMALVSMLYTHRNVAGVTVTVTVDEPVFAGRDLEFRVCLSNPGRRRRLRLRLFVEHEERAVVDLAPGSSSCATLTTPTRRRGVIKLPAVVVASDYPLGLLFTWSKQYQPVSQGLAWPRPVGNRPWQLSLDRRRYQDAGQQLDGDDFRGLRAFRDGDAPQHVHWKAAARGLGMFTKEFAGAGQDTLWLDWGALAGLEPEARLEQMSSWAVAAERAGLCYGLRLPATRIPPARGHAHRRACLDALARY